jgi:hypothetical protein
VVHAEQGNRPALFPNCSRLRSLSWLHADRVGACAPTDPRQLTGRPDPSRCKWSLEKAAEAVDLKNSEFESALLTLSEHVRKFRDLTVLFFNPKGHI